MGEFSRARECFEKLDQALEALRTKTGAARCGADADSNPIEGNILVVICKHPSEEHHKYGSVVDIPDEYTKTTVDKCNFALHAIADMIKRVDEPIGEEK